MMSSSNMAASFVLAILVLVPSVAHAQSRCCSPSKLTADVVSGGEWHSQVSLEYDLKLAFENHYGKDGLAYRLYDGNNMVAYERKSNGECKKYPITYQRPLRCVPDYAVHAPISDENGVALDGWVFNQDSETTRLLIVKQNGCLPYRNVAEHADQKYVYHYINVAEGIKDSSVFQKDLSDCVDA